MSDEAKEAGGGGSAPSWKDRFKLRGDLRQRDVYAFDSAASALGGMQVDSSSILADHALKAAIEAGWLEEPGAEVLTDASGKKRYMLEGVEVGDLHPGKVRWYGVRVMSHYTQAVTPPPN